MCQGEQRILIYCPRCQRIDHEQVDAATPCDYVERNRAAWCQTRPQRPGSDFLQGPCDACRENELQQSRAGFYSHQRRPGETAASVIDSEGSDIIPLPANGFRRQDARHENGHFEDDRRPRRPQPTRPFNEYDAGSRDRGRPTTNAPVRDDILVDDEAARQAMMRDLRNRGVLSREQSGSTNYRRLIDAALPAFLANDRAGYESAVALFMETIRPNRVRAEPANCYSVLGDSDSDPPSTVRSGGTRRTSFGPGSHAVIRDASGRLCDVRPRQKTSTRNGRR